MRPDDRRPIGVFDSGVGGLTVLKAIGERLPGESTLYLGDTARVPYGTKSGEVVTRYSLRTADFLVARDIKLLVVACNTASAVALPALREHLRIPVLGVIEPGAHAAAQRTHTGRIGVIGTPGTIRSGAYQRALVAARADARVSARPCPLFVPLAEEGWTSGVVPREVARTYLSEMAASGVDTLVLGCTHYPVLKTVIAEVMGPGVTLVDSAEATATAVDALLTERPELRATGGTPQHRYFVTDVPEPFQAVGERFLGRRIEHAEHVDV